MSTQPYTLLGTKRFATSLFARLVGKQTNLGHAEAAGSLARAGRVRSAQWPRLR